MGKGASGEGTVRACKSGQDWICVVDLFFRTALTVREEYNVFYNIFSNVVCFLKIVTQLISHCPEAAARDFPTGTSLLLSEGVGPVDMLSLGASTSCPLSLIPI